MRTTACSTLKRPTRRLSTTFLPLAGCEHAILATADIMGIPLSCDRFTPPPGLHSLESDEDFDDSHVIESQLVGPVETLGRDSFDDDHLLESQLVDPVEIF